MTRQPVNRDFSLEIRAYLTVRMIQATGSVLLIGPLLRCGFFHLTAGRPVATALWTLELQCGIPVGTLRITPAHDVPCRLCTEQPTIRQSMGYLFDHDRNAVGLGVQGI